MTEEFIAWFDNAVPEKMWGNSKEEREDLKFYCWLSWRDSRRVGNGGV